MNRTPDEIKKGLECCKDTHCKVCPYFNIHRCAEENGIDALALIQQLQADNAQQARCIENMTDKLNAMNDEVAKLQAEIEEYEEAANKCCYESQCNAELNHLEALCKRLKDENEQLQAERDALMHWAKGRCDTCAHKDDCVKHDPDPEGYVMHWYDDCEIWEWRGVQKEDK